MGRRGLAGALTLALASGLLVGTAPSASAAPPPGWTAVEPLTSGADAADFPRPVIDDRGNETVIYVGGATKQVYAKSRAAGSTSWASAVPITGSDGAAAADDVVADASGTLTAVWRYYDSSNSSYVVEAARKPAGGDWGSVQPLSDSANNSVPDPADVAVDAQGNVTVVWSATPASGPTLARTSRWTASGGWSAPETLSDGSNDVSDVHVAADPGGDVMAVWTYLGAPQIVQSDLFVTGTGWQVSPDTVPATTGSPGSPQVAPVANGTFAAIWVGNDGSHDVVEAAKYTGTSWAMLPSPMLAGGYDAQAPQITASATGDIGVVYQTSGSGVWQVQGTTLPSGAGGWDAVAALSNGSQDSRSPLVTSDALGDMVAVWTRSDGTNWRVETADRPAGGTWEVVSTTPLSDAGTDATALQVTSDAYGNVSTVWKQPDSSAVPQIEESRWTSRAPIANVTEPTSTFFKKERIRVSWAGVDWSGGTGSVASYVYNVGVATGAWNRQLGAYAPWVSGTTGTDGLHSAKPGRTYCFEAQGTDSDPPLVTGPWSTPVCTTTPVDDRTANVSAGWSRQRIKGFYDNTGSVTTWRGATMTLKGVKARQLALLVAKGPKNGRIWVFFGNQDLGTFSLSAHKNKKKVTIDLATFSKVKKGTLTIIAVTGGKQIRIDGIYAAK